MARLEAIRGDITKQETDAVVNAANSSLLGGGGVDGAIHRAAGAELLEACRKIGGCPAGETRTTPGFRLGAKWVIHAVGPVWRGGRHGEDEKLAGCYRGALAAAADHDARSIAFPCISTGVYGFPKDRAARIAFDAVKGQLEKYPRLERVVFVCFGEEDFRLYQSLLHEGAGKTS